MIKIFDPRLSVLSPEGSTASLRSMEDLVAEDCKSGAQTRKFTVRFSRRPGDEARLASSPGLFPGLENAYEANACTQVFKKRIKSLKIGITKLEESIQLRNADFEDRYFRLSLIENSKYDGTMVWKIPTFGVTCDACSKTVKYRPISYGPHVYCNTCFQRLVRPSSSSKSPTDGEKFKKMKVSNIIQVSPVGSRI